MELRTIIPTSTIWMNIFKHKRKRFSKMPSFIILKYIWKYLKTEITRRRYTEFELVNNFQPQLAIIVVTGSSTLIFSSFFHACLLLTEIPEVRTKNTLDRARQIKWKQSVAVEEKKMVRWKNHHFLNTTSVNVLFAIPPTWGIEGKTKAVRLLMWSW